MSYSVGVTQDGRGGEVDYVEGGQRLSFEWDFTTEGLVIYVPSPEKWDQYSEENRAPWAAGRRREILTRLAEGLRDKKARGAKISIENDWIHLTFEDSWLSSLL